MGKQSKNCSQKHHTKSNTKYKQQQELNYQDLIDMYLAIQKPQTNSKDEIFIEYQSQQPSRDEDRIDAQIPGQIQPKENVPSLFPQMVFQQVQNQHREQVTQIQPSITQKPKKGQKTKIISDPILHSNFYDKVKELDFQIYTSSLQRNNMYGSMLLDCYGRILWCDKLAHQLFEGSLNNFDTMKIQDLLLKSRLNFFLQQMKHLDFSQKNTILKWAIYSKLLKRRYKDYPLPSDPQPSDYFNKFLKCVTVRIRPFLIKIDEYKDPQGYCNEQLLKQLEENKCFYLEVRKSKQLLPLEDLNMLSDPIILKFTTKREVKDKKPERLGRRILDAFEQLKQQEDQEAQADEIFQESSQSPKKGKAIFKNKKREGDKSTKKAKSKGQGRED